MNHERIKGTIRDAKYRSYNNYILVYTETFIYLNVVKSMYYPLVVMD